MVLRVCACVCFLVANVKWRGAKVSLSCCCLQEVTRSWFSSLFCTALPAETAVRIWDVLFLEGPKILFRVALALFKVWHHLNSQGLS